jgi:hypothetical protein
LLAPEQPVAAPSSSSKKCEFIVLFMYCNRAAFCIRLTSLMFAYTQPKGNWVHPKCFGHSVAASASTFCSWCVSS